MKPFEYNVKEAVAKSALVEWQFSACSECETLVVPDGCRDIIVKYHSNTRPSIFVSELSNAAFLVPSTGNTQMRGVRLRPGTQIDRAALLSWIETHDTAKLYETDQLDEFCFEPNGLSEVLDCLASHHLSVSRAADELGVSIKSVQRLVKSATGLAPHFWLSLARARKAARMLFECSDLSEAAFDAGYSDQAHMNREIKKWFGRTPGQLRTDADINNQLLEPGYG